jgi:hypothetical protein
MPILFAVHVNLDLKFEWLVKEMIQKIVKKCNMDDFSSIREDLSYWLSRPPEERVATVDYLRRQYHGNTARLQRSARVIQLIQPDRSNHEL